MYLKYCLISLINFFSGIFIGFLINYFRNKKILKSSKFSNSFLDSQTELLNYSKSLKYHFLCTSKLLDNISKEYKNLHQYMSKNTDKLLLHSKDNNDLSLKNPINRDSLIKIPRDYSDDS